MKNVKMYGNAIPRPDWRASTTERSTTSTSGGRSRAASGSSRRIWKAWMMYSSRTPPTRKTTSSIARRTPTRIGTPGTVRVRSRSIPAPAPPADETTASAIVRAWLCRLVAMICPADIRCRRPISSPTAPAVSRRLGVVADPLERLERRAPVDPEGPGEGVERSLDMVVVRDLDRGRPCLEHGRGQDPIDPLPGCRRGREDGDAEQCPRAVRCRPRCRGGRPRRSCSRPRPWAGRTRRPGGGGRGSARAASRRGPRRLP